MNEGWKSEQVMARSDFDAEYKPRAAADTHPDYEEMFKRWDRHRKRRKDKKDFITGKILDDGMSKEEAEAFADEKFK